MCEFCENNKILRSCNFAGSGEIRIYNRGFEKGIGMLELQGDGMKAKIFKNLYCPRFDINYCPKCRKEAGRVKTILKRYVETLDNHKGIVVKQYKPTGRNIDSIHIQQENGRIWYCPISDVIYVKEESYE